MGGPVGGPGSGSLDDRRAQAVEILGEHFARDALTLPELEERIDRVSRARSAAELRDVLAGLPGLEGDLPASVDPEILPSRRAAVPPDRVPDRDFAMAILGGAKRAGSWSPPRHLFAVGIMGGVELDFREARLGPGVTEVTCFAVMGGIDIVVPPDLPVVASGVGILGGFEHRSQGDRSDLEPSTPLLKVNGVATMGAVEVEVRHPGETKRDARKRRKAERKRRGS